MIEILESDLIGDLPDPHSYRARGVYSVRPNRRSHHRVHIVPSELPRTEYEYRTVTIVDGVKDYDPFKTQWSQAQPGYRIVNHFRPDDKVDRELNRRQRDWKHRFRDDPATGRANSIASLRYRDPRLPYLAGALSTNDPFVVADSAIALIKGRFK